MGTLLAMLMIGSFIQHGSLKDSLFETITEEDVERNNHVTAKMIADYVTDGLDVPLTKRQHDDLEYQLYLVVRKNFTREWYFSKFRLALAEVYRPDEYAAVMRGTFPPTPKYLERYDRFQNEVLPRVMDVMPYGFEKNRKRAIDDFLTKNNIVIER